MATGSSKTPGPHTPDPTLAAIAQASIATAQASAVTADAVLRLLAVSRFGPTAGAGAGSGGFGGYGPGGGATPGMSGPTPKPSAFALGQQSIAERADMMSRLGFGGAGASMSRTAQFAGGLKDAGFSGAAAMAQRAAIPLAIAGMVASGAEKAAGYHYDKYSTTDQKLRSFVRDFVPGGERGQRFVDAMSGRAAAMEEADIQGRYRMAEGRNRLSLSRFESGFNPQQSGREALARAYGGQSAVAPSVFDRSTALGERAYREEQRMLQLRLAETKAERDAAAAAAERVGAQAELNKLVTRGAELARNRGRLKEKVESTAESPEAPGSAGATPTKLERPSYALWYHLFRDGSTGSGPDRQKALREVEANEAEIQGNLSLQQAARQGLLAAEGRDASARAESRKAFLATRLIGRAERLESRAELNADNARRLGGMNAFDRAFGLAAARHIIDRGSTDGLPAEYLQAGYGFDPTTVGKIQEQTGLKSAEFKAAAGDPRFAATYGAGNPNDLNTEAAKLRKKFAEEGFSADAAAASAFAGAGKIQGREIGLAIRAELEGMKAEILNTIRLGRNPG